MNKESTPQISIVIPAYNEAESVSKLHAELLSVLKPLGQSFEIIFINDGSTDNTLEELKKFHPVRILSFSRNFGKSQALQAGFSVARGEYVFTMDSDLQDDPQEIPNFLRRMQDSKADLVCGWKQNRLDGRAKNTVSKVANAVTRMISGTSVHDMNCGFKLYRSEVVKALDLYGDMHRYIPALAAAKGFNVTEVPVHHRQRKFGVSKYGNFRRLGKSFFDFVTLMLLRRFIDKPMHFFGILGTLLSFIGFVILAYLSYEKLFLGHLIGNRPMLMLGVLFVVIGVQLFSSGFLGELLIRQGSRVPVYTIREDIEQ